MNDTEGVRGTKPHERLLGESDRLNGRKARLCRKLITERAALEELHHDARVARGGGPKVDHFDDVGMTQARGGLSFEAEAIRELSVPDQVGAEHFQNELATQDLMLDQVDVPSSATAQPPDGAIVGIRQKLLNFPGRETSAFSFFLAHCEQYRSQDADRFSNSTKPRKYCVPSQAAAWTRCRSGWRL